MQKVKLNSILFSVIILLAMLTMVLSIVGIKKIENRILFLDQQMWEKYKEIMQEPITDSYILSSYLKDTIINVSIYKDYIKILLALMMVTVAILCFAKKTRLKSDSTSS